MTPGGVQEGLQGWRGEPYPQSQPISTPDHPYPQHQPNSQQISPRFVPPVPLIAQQPHHFRNINPSQQTLLPAQMIPNSNNKLTQVLNSIELQTLPCYLVLIVPIHEIQLWSGRVVNDKPRT